MPEYTYLIVGGGMTADAAVHGTLVYAAHDEEHNGALVLKLLLERRKK